MDVGAFEALFTACERDADRVLIAFTKIHEALSNSSGSSEVMGKPLSSSLGLVIQRINQINYSTQFLSKNVANDIISDLTRLIHVQDVDLSLEFSWLVLNFLNKQEIIIDNDVEHIAGYFLKSLQVTSLTKSSIQTVVLHLRALGTVIYGNVRRLNNVHGQIISSLRTVNQSFSQLVKTEEIQESDQLSLFCAKVQCLENLTADSANSPSYLDQEHQKAVIQQLLLMLQKLRGFACSSEDCLYYKTVMSSLKGLKNIMEISRSFPNDLVGHLIDVVQAYSVLGHSGLQVIQRQKTGPELDKTEESVGDEGSASAKAGDRILFRGTGEDDSAGSRVAPSSSVKKKQRNKKSSKMSKKSRPTSKDGDSDVEMEAEVHFTPSKSGSAGTPALGSQGEDFWDMLGISDSSDLSDGELNQSFSKTSGNNFAGKIRAQSLTVFHTGVKCMDRRTLFGHWQTIFPDRFICSWNQLSNYPLLVIIAKDPSHKMRLAALSIMAVLLDGSKQFLMSAEDGAQYHNVAYTPFSVSLGNMVKELHRCLLLTLVKEQVALVLVQAIKCLGMLVANSPYHRLKPGLLNKTVKFVSHFLSHKDANIKVVALTCLGKVVSVHAPLGEVIQLLENKPSKVSFSSSGFFHQKEGSDKNGDESGYYDDLDFKAVSFSGSGTPTPQRTGSAPDCRRPLDPDDSDPRPVAGDLDMRGMSWLVKSCSEIILSGCRRIGSVLDFVLSSLSSDLVPTASSPVESSSFYVHAVPVRVEALHLMTLLTQNYFVIVRPHLKAIQMLACSCLLSDLDNSIQLHAIKLIEALTSSVLLNQTADKADSSVYVPLREALSLWYLILKGPIQRALANNSDSMVEMVACEALGNIGPEVFQKLPEKASLFVKTIMLGYSSVTNHRICIGALSAIGRSVNYPCLSDDPLFLADASNAVLRSLRTNNLGVVTKAAWVLSNLSDALVSKRLDEVFMRKIPDLLLLKLLDGCIELCSSHDKPRSNALRSIGNLLNFLPPQFLDSGKFDESIRRSLDVIIRYIHTGSVKVRWNACYAFGNIMWNEPVLSFLSHKMTEAYGALLKAVRTCKNFKVRISAATVLAVPSRREMFFRGEEERSSSRIFLEQEMGRRKQSVGRMRDEDNRSGSVFFYRYTLSNVAVSSEDLERFHPGSYTLEVEVESEFGMMGREGKKVGCCEDCFSMVWEGVLAALLECESTPVDFTEMKYKGILMSRLTITLLHLLSLVVPGDLELCRNSLFGHEEKLKKFLQMTRDEIENKDNNVVDDADVVDGIGPRCREDVYRAKIDDSLKKVARHFSKLPKCASLTESHLASLESLSAIFVSSASDVKNGKNAGSNMELKFLRVYD